jgi:hypothetical protein
MTRDNEYGLKILDIGRTLQQKSEVEKIVMEDIASAPENIVKILRESLAKFLNGDFNNAHQSFTISRQVSGLRYDIMMALGEIETAKRKAEQQDTDTKVKRIRNFQPGGY